MGTMDKFMRYIRCLIYEPHLSLYLIEMQNKNNGRYKIRCFYTSYL